jgi:hypothetical protein
VTGAEPPRLPGLVPVPTYRDTPVTEVVDLTGVDLAGRPVAVAVVGPGRWTLLLFLSSGCLGCREFFAAAGDPASSGLVTDETVVVVTRDRGHEDLAALADLVVPGTPVLMSSLAWRAYRVHGPPFFVLAEGSRTRAVTEGVAWGVDQVAAHLRAARAGSTGPEVPRLIPPADAESR